MPVIITDNRFAKYENQLQRLKASSQFLSESAQGFGGNLFLDHLRIAVDKSCVYIHPETSVEMPWGRLMKLGNPEEYRPNNV